ncbi:unnamed protein product [Clonostachys byssicola]|uniref:O-methyltransferase C-terminal domain-containing protein n=1 Tax=Clonostachys byssicola TaxID=160290 RepID=A0A9N9U9R5_9HYPO|nr:unnamed protein product [Clonostachys byssicola]
MASPSSTPRIVELAAQISSSVTELQERLSAQGIPSPSFAEDSPPDFPADLESLRDSVIDATAELNELLLDPLQLLYRFAAIPNMVGIDAISRYNIAGMVPHGGQISFAEISERTGMDKGLVRRLMRHAMSMRIFREPEPEMVAHTKISKYLSIPYINAWASFEGRDTWPAATRVMDAVEKWPGSEEPNQTAFSLANNTDKPVFEFIGAYPERMMRFGAGMKAVDHVPGHAPELISKDYDWASLGNASIVNVGGGRGQIAIELAQNFENVKLTVQDAAMMVEGAESDVPNQLKGRVEFMKHELFDTQTLEADAYFFRMVFRNWCDKYAIQILKAQIPALRPGAKILIQDACMPEHDSVPLWRERVQRSVDLMLKCYTNGRTRYLDEWKALLAAADERFKLHQVFLPENSLLSILEIHWVQV